MAVCVPMRELKNTAEFTKLVCESDEPVTVTRNGREAFISMTPERYEALRMEAARAQLYASVQRAEEDIAQGKTVAADTVIASLRERHGIER